MGTKRKQGTVKLEDETNNVVFPSQHHIHPHSSSSVIRSTRDYKPLHFTLKIQSFSLLKTALAKSHRDRYESHTFDVAGYKWKLALKRIYGCADHMISLYLVSADDNILFTTSEVNVMFTFLVYDTLKDKYLTIQDGKIRRFHAMKTEWGFENLVSLNTFNDSSNGLLVDDCCVFGVDIFVMKCNDGIGEVLSLINRPTFNNYTWKINNFSKLDANLNGSNPFTVESYLWKIQLYPNGDSRAKSGFLSMYLMFDSSNKLPQGSQVYAEYEMAVLSQLQAIPLKQTYNCWFGFGGIVGSGWGASNFLSLSDLKEPTKGYLVNDTLVVEVKINVISTLKAIV